MGSIKATNKVVRFDYGKVKSKDIALCIWYRIAEWSIKQIYVCESLEKKVTFIPHTKIQTAQLYIQIKTC